MLEKLPGYDAWKLDSGEGHPDQDGPWVHACEECGEYLEQCQQLLTATAAFEVSAEGDLWPLCPDCEELAQAVEIEPDPIQCTICHTSMPKREYRKTRSGTVVDATLCQGCKDDIVAPRAGAWIETRSSHRHRLNCGVAPRAGAWIETTFTTTAPSGRSCRPPCGGVD